MTGRIRIGIVGGGLAGITVAIALVKHPHVDVQVYESAPNFTEQGAGIGLSPLALQALDDIIPSAVDFLKTHAGAVEVEAARLVVGSGPDAGALISDLGIASGVTMNRAPLLQALLSLLPGDLLHAAKRVKSLEQTDSDVTGPEKYAASPAGCWDCRHLVSFEKARAALGDESFKVDRQYAWLGDGAAMLHGIVENRTMVQCIIAVLDKSLSTDRKRVVARQVLEDALPASWYEGPVAKGMVELILDQEDPKGYAIWGRKSTPTYANNQVCIVGDAAHTTAPWQSAGAGMAIEDAFILGHLLSNVSSVGEINGAFRAFDALRRPRCQRVIDTGRKTGRLFYGQDEVARLDPKKLNESLGLTFAHVGALNLESHKNDALETMRAFLGS
ncbi:FAD/NAD(P)-binding domain-containing protein [Hypoxylon crocopeplum]|nr:FAD/NAD(P)-binding domain-containing protein [Hypoxylon crocopeplum]